jgi:hypothetical protein
MHGQGGSASLVLERRPDSLPHDAPLYVDPIWLGLTVFDDAWRAAFGNAK